MEIASLVPPLVALVLAPLIPAIVARVKAIVAGRKGIPLLQPYRDLRKLLGKGAVYSRTTTAVFRAGPIVGLAALAAAAVLVPLGGLRAPIAFEGDIILFAYLLGLARFAWVIAALDTGSSFEGMGASREVLYASLAEPALLIGIAALARKTGSLSLSGIVAGIDGAAWTGSAPALALVAASLVVVLLAECARIPFDDPTTHLELTMVHEVMILDHGGPDLALLEYAAAVKVWLLGALVAGVLVPWKMGPAWATAAAAAGGIAALAVAVGAVECSMARLRLVRTPQILVGASVAAVLALVLVLRDGGAVMP